MRCQPPRARALMHRSRWNRRARDRMRRWRGRRVEWIAVRRDAERTGARRAERATVSGAIAGIVAIGETVASAEIVANAGRAVGIGETGEIAATVAIAHARRDGAIRVTATVSATGTATAIDRVKDRVRPVRAAVGRVSAAAIASDAIRPP